MSSSTSANKTPDWKDGRIEALQRQLEDRNKDVSEMRAFVEQFKSRRHKEGVVCVCEGCKGEGITRHDELSDYHRREYRVWHETCRRCGGSGRVVIETVTYERPYEPPAQPKAETDA